MGNLTKQPREDDAGHRLTTMLAMLGAATVVAIGLITVVLYAAANRDPALASDPAASSYSPSEAEYNHAIARYITCAEEAGWRRHSAVGSSPGPAMSVLTYPDPNGPNRDTLARAKASLDDCFATHLETIQSAWSASRPRPTRVELGDLYAALEQCVRDGGRPGVELPAFGAYAVYRDAPAPHIRISNTEVLAYRQCAVAIEHATGLIAPPPLIADTGTPEK